MGKNKKNKKEKEKEEKTINDCSDVNEQEDNIEHAQKKDKKHKKNKKNLKQDIDDVEQNQKSDKKLKIANDNHKNEPVQQTDIEEKVEYPYEVDKDDHCETPLDAYLDIMPILMEICKNTGKSTQELAIYDPYFCQGRMKENLATIGFTNVYNKKEDFYKVIEAKKVPNYDVLITNPPYSEEHIQKIVDFCVKQEKPWFLLVPNFVYNKEWYLKLLKQKDPWRKPFYILPQERYSYLKEGKMTSPFISFWYIYLGEQNKQNQILESVRVNLTKLRHCQIIKKIEQIPQNFKDSNDPNRVRLRKKQREQMKKQKNNKSFKSQNK